MTSQRGIQTADHRTSTRDYRVEARDRALARLRRVTIIATGSGAALAALFAVVAAGPASHARAAVGTSHRAATASTVAAPVGAGAAADGFYPVQVDPSAAISQPTSAPQQSVAPPVAVSGGS